MHLLEKTITTVPVDQLEGVVSMLGRMMKIDVEDVPKKFKKAFDQTRESAYGNFSMKSIYVSYSIESNDGERIRLADGQVIESKLMAEMFRESFELVVLVTALFGYDEAESREENMVNKLFLDNWGTAFVECGYSWVKSRIAQELEGKGLYTTHSFSPGQNDIPLELQTLLFRLLEPEAIGVSLNDRYMMHPKKSVSGLIGIMTHEDENKIRPCDLCEKRDTCPNAYA